MNKWIKVSVITVVYACLWLLFIYVYYGDIEPVGITIGLSLLFGLCMTGVECFFHRDKKQ